MKARNLQNRYILRSKKENDRDRFLNGNLIGTATKRFHLARYQIDKPMIRTDEWPPAPNVPIAFLIFHKFGADAPVTR